MMTQERKYLEGIAPAPGLTWRGLASRLGVDGRRRPGLRLPAAPGRQRESGGNGNPDSDGQGG